MSRRSVLLAVALAATGTLLLSDVAVAWEANTEVTIGGTNGDYHGKIFSGRGKCLGGRTVKVYKVKSGPDLLIGTDTSERDGDIGKWSIGNSGYPHGKFYARAKRKELLSGDLCKADTSPTIQR